MKRMEVNQDSDRTLVVEKLQYEFRSLDAGKVRRSMDLTARLWLNLHVRSGDYPLGPTLSEMTDIEWTRKASVKTLISCCFQKSSYAANERHQRIDADFTVENLRRFCRVNV